MLQEISSLSLHDIGWNGTLGPCECVTTCRFKICQASTCINFRLWSQEKSLFWSFLYGKAQHLSKSWAPAGQTLLEWQQHPVPLPESWIEMDEMIGASLKTYWRREIDKIMREHNFSVICVSFVAFFVAFFLMFSLENPVAQCRE